MKKFAILTSVLALAACGGGSHHAGERVRVTEEPTYQQQYLLTTEQARASNAKVTTMVSEIAVCQNCASPRTTDARLSTKSQGDYEFKVYDLRDVKFVMADEGFGGEMQFDIDESNGEITKFNLLPDADDPEDEGMVFSRKEDNIFEGNVNTEAEEPEKTDLTYVSMSKIHDLGLKYSDFGYFDIAAVENWRAVFIGGYDDVKKIAVNDIKNNENTKFTGRATGSVMGRKTIGEYQYEDQPQLALDGTANLVFNNGTSELTAKFNNWYDLKYTENGENKSIVFSNYKDTPLETKDNNGNDITLNNYYQFIGDNTGNITFNNETHQIRYDFRNTENNPGAEPEVENINYVNSDIRYYGDNNVASEAVGLIQVRDCADALCSGDKIENSTHHDDEVRMNLSFGATEVK